MTPPTPTGDALVGMSIDQVKKDLGPPDSETQGSQKPGFGPWPNALPAGASCTTLYYSNHQGEQLHVFCVTPQIYAQVHGTTPQGNAQQTAQQYVLEVARYPAGTVF